MGCVNSHKVFPWNYYLVLHYPSNNISKEGDKK